MTDQERDEILTLVAMDMADANIKRLRGFSEIEIKETWGDWQRDLP